MNNDFSRAAELAARITDTARNTLLIKLRFMDTAIFRLSAKPEDLETFSAQQGFGAGNMIQQLKELNREKYDYAVFLRKFAVMGETMKVNDEEFDYIFYTYGLKLFKNIPLIEPLEYKEEKRIRDFVVAIDTSGSTSGETVQKFLNKTYNILKNSESYFSKVNI